MPRHLLALLRPLFLTIDWKPHASSPARHLVAKGACCPNSPRAIICDGSSHRLGRAPPIASAVAHQHPCARRIWPYQPSSSLCIPSSIIAIFSVYNLAVPSALCPHPSAAATLFSAFLGAHLSTFPSQLSWWHTWLTKTAAAPSHVTCVQFSGSGIGIHPDPSFIVALEQNQPTCQAQVTREQ